MTSSKQPLRILQVVGGMVRGGIETWLTNVLRHIDRDRFQIDFLVHTDQPCAYDDEIRALGCQIIPCLNRKQPWIYARDFKRILQEYGPYDIVHSQVHLFSGCVLRLAAQENVPVRIAHIHPLTDINEKQLLRPIYRWIMTRWISRSTTHVIAPSKKSLEAFQAICDCSGKQIDILYNGIELERFSKVVNKNTVRQKYHLPLDIPVVIYVARFAPHKNHEQILRLADQINCELVEAHFIMVGSHGELLETLTEKIKDRNDISIFTGVEDVSELLNAADLFFFPSLEEGFGVVAIEAAAAGLPVVATNLPTIREACSHSHQAFMFPPNDDATARASILKILGDQQLKQNLSYEAREWSTKFSIENSVDRLVSLYEQSVNV